MKLSTFNISFIVAFTSLIPLSANATNLPVLTDSQYINIIELVIAGIVAAALIISVLVLFLGRWVGNKEKSAIQVIRQDAEKEKNNLASITETLYQQKEEAASLTLHMINQAEEFHLKREEVEEYANDIIATSKRIQLQEEKLIQSSNSISERMNETQSHWDTQLSSTVSTVQEVQINLDKTLNLVDQDLGALQEQKQLSKDLLQDFLNKHKEQSQQINTNSDIANEVSKNLEKTLHESSQLVEILKKHQGRAEKSMSKFTEELTNFEEQAYEQFDSSFQVADLARQELIANIDESHTHIENMRRHEEQSRLLNTQTRKNLEMLDYSKIVRISSTLDSTQDMFSDIRDKVESTKRLFDELKDIEADVRKSASSTDDIDQYDDFIEENNLASASVYKMASGDNNPVSFFTKIKDKN